MFHNLVKSYQLKKIRNLMRGFRHAFIGQKIDEIRRLESSLLECEITVVPGLTEKVVFGDLLPKLPIMLRQFLLQQHSGPKLQKALFSSLGAKTALIHPMPAEWQHVLMESRIIKLNRWVSSFLWGALIFTHYVRACFLVVRLSISGLMQGFASSVTPKESFVCFLGLKKNNLPNTTDCTPSYDICSWYSHWQGRNRDVKTLVHDAPDISPRTLADLQVKYLPLPYASLENINQTVRFICWALPSLTLAFFSMLIGRWWNVLLLTEAVRAKIVNFAPKNSLATDYFFHFSRDIYRPMWTYVAEAKGAGIVCYFYSTYAVPKLRLSIDSQKLDWGPSTWPIFLVWDTYHADVLRRDLGKEIQIKVVGPVYFSDMAIEVPIHAEQAVAVFDIQPHRKSLSFGTSTIYEYYYSTQMVHRRFLEDVYEALSAAGLFMALKAKRDIGAKGEKTYQTMVNRLAKNEDVIILPADIAAPRLMQACIGAISSPFTSTALYFKNQGYPSVYYDPLGVLYKNDPASHGIPLLNSKAELQDWVDGLSDVKLANLKYGK